MPHPTDLPAVLFARGSGVSVADGRVSPHSLTGERPICCRTAAPLRHATPRHASTPWGPIRALDLEADCAVRPGGSERLSPAGCFTGG